MALLHKRIGVGAIIAVALLFAAMAFSYQNSNASVLGDTDKLSDKLVQTLESDDGTLYYDVLIVFDERGSSSQLDGYNRDYHVYNNFPIARVLLNKDEIAEVSQWNEVRFIEPNQSMKLNNAEGREMTNAEEVQEALGYTGQGVEVAIIDTGLDGLHPDVQHNQYRNWQVGGTIFLRDGLYASTTPDNTDLETIVFDAEAEAGVPVNNDEYGHGTHVYGTIAGNGEASDGELRGMAPEATVHSYSTSTGLFLVYTVEAYDHIIDLVKNGEADIRLISNSWGSSGCDFNPDNVTNEVTKTAFDLGILSVFAYGNDGSASNTCNPYTTAPYVLGIGATDKTYSLTGFSSRGKEDGNFDREAALSNFKEYLAATDEEQANWNFTEKPIALHRPSVVAPGADIVSTQNPAHPMTTSGTYYGSASGTSMATPMVTGVLALIIDAYEQNNDGRLSPTDLIRLVEVTANTEVMNGYQEFEAGAGFIDAKAAVERAVNNDIPTEVTDEHLVKFEMPENVVVKSKPYEGTVLINSWQTNEGYETHTFKVEEGALKAYADITWANDLENVYISLYGPGGDVTDVNAADAQSAGLLDTSSERFVEVLFPEPGTWTVRIDGRNNTITDYNGKWEVTYPEVVNHAPEATLDVTPEKVSGNEDINVAAKVLDKQGVEDVAEVNLTVESSNGKLLYQFTKDDFTAVDGQLQLEASDLKLTGKAPWILKLRATDVAGEQVYKQALVGRK
ncbi:S8 family peptidase [Salirhabdus salicampi]|uniref:S8 family peptidase n=1 Tax=Salirhabdus salicampi TaxID=476102 RepID=UPI0020C3B9EF|nr:S8 family serine peptidase [Salirhabdus salicampi]MCP8616295.1 S8 family serine peptidase [Salirhabdus salicampi]